MQSIYFWTGESIRDITIIVALLFFLCNLLPLILWRNFYKEGLTAIFFRSEHLYIKEVRKRIPIYWLVLLSYLLISLQLGFALVIILENLSLIPIVSLSQIISYSLLYSTLFLLFLLIDRGLFSLYGYLFIVSSAQDLWKQSFQIGLWMLPLCCSIGLFILSIPTSFPWSIFYFLVILLLWRGYIAMQSYRAFSQSSSKSLLFFLYLCTCEIVPITLLGEVLYMLK